MIDSLKKIYSLFPAKDRFKFLILFGMMLVASLFEVLGIGVVLGFVTAVAKPDTLFNHPVFGEWLSYLGINTTESLAVFGAISLILLIILKSAYLIFYKYAKLKFVTGRGVYLQNRMLHAYMTAPYTFFLSRNSAQLLRNVTAEVGKIIQGTLLPFLEVVLKALMFIFIISFLFWQEPLITVVAIVVLGGCGFLFLNFTQKRTRQAGKDDRDARGDMNKIVLQGLGGFKDARVLNREKMFLEQYYHFAQISRKAKIYRSIVNQLPKPIIEALVIMGILLITLILTWEGRDFASIAPVLALFGYSAIKMMPIFSTVIGEITTVRYSAYSVYTIFEDLQLLEIKYKKFRKQVLNEAKRMELRHQIDLKSVTYYYPDSDEQVVRDVSLTIPKGHAVAFVGPSGAGKTTLVDIILGLLEPQKGTLEVDGQDVHKNIRGWMQNIGYIPQSIYLLDDRMRRNIAFGIPDDEVDEEKLENAIRAAQLEELIERLPKGQRTKLGERGVRISGGQQQRVGIARALYNNPQVLIMDEATSALDNLTEKFVIDAIERLRGDRTIIMIAHRLTTVQNCDTIYMMNEGRVIAQGTYDELLTNSVDFRRMSLQE